MTNGGPLGHDKPNGWPEGLPATEAELLAYVEDQLDASARSELESRLGDRPQVVSALREMANDRAVLRSAGRPALPHDFLEELEPSVARPMLYVSPDPKRLGTYRRQQRRARRAKSLRKYAVAAAVLVGALAVVWTTYLVARMSGGSSADRFIADEPPVDTDRAATAVVDAGRERETTSSRESSTAVATMQGGATDDERAGASEAAVERLVAEAPVELAIRIHIRPVGGEGVTIAECERRLVEHLEALASESTRSAGSVQPAPPTGEPPVALVRNFNEEEARAILARVWSQRRSVERPPAVAGVLDAVETDHRSTRTRLRTLTEALSSTARALEDEAEAAIEGRQIFGPAALSPDYARQLALSSEGATHVATLPLGELATLLDRLFADADLSAELSAGMGEAAANGWAEGLRAARQAIAEAQRTYGERVLIAMPMAIDAPAGEGG